MPSPSRTPDQRRPSTRRDELVAVATRLFAERGYHGTSMADLAGAMGVQKGSLYSLTESKQELLVAVKVGIPRDVAADQVASTIDAAERAIRQAEPVAQVIYIEPDIYVEGHVTDPRPKPPEPAAH